MNAGAYGGEISNILQSCKVLTKDGEIETLSAKDLAFGYRHSAIHCKKKNGKRKTRPQTNKKKLVTL